MVYNMHEKTCKARINRDILSLGVERGDTVLVHSSFKPLGPVPGGIETLIQGLLQAIGPYGTLVMPASCPDLRPPQEFDVRLTPVTVGVIPEYFRTRPETFRSIHPTISVCAVGNDAHDLLYDHYLDSTPCGPNSPFTRITERPVKIIMLGCGIGPNTTMHAFEEYVGQPNFLKKTFMFTITDWSGRSYQKEYVTQDFKGFKLRYDRVLKLCNGFIRRGKVLAAETFVLETISLKNAVIKKLREDPFYFMEEIGIEP